MTASKAGASPAWLAVRGGPEAVQAVPGEVNFRAQAAAGAPEGVVVRFGPVWRPCFPAPAACW
ncbi:hypothetical protein GCM10017752_02620 [Streptomyces roseoviridis]